MGGINKYEDLLIWQRAHELTLMVYQLSTKFPYHEVNGLSSQLRRASVSVASNIAEGFGRYLKNDSIRFYRISYASLLEVKYQILLAKDLKYIKESEYILADEACESLRKMIPSWISRVYNFDTS